MLDLAGVAEACRGADYVLHQAAIPSVPRSVADPIETNRANIDGTLNLLVAARDAKVKRVVYASSSSLYGDTPELPKREDMIPNPISPYAVSKLTGEYYMTSFYRVYGLETVSLRYFNVFGPYQDPTSMYSGVLAIFISKMLAGEQPTIHGDGEQSRDFTFIDNTVQANLLACHAPANEVVGKGLQCRHATARDVERNLFPAPNSDRLQRRGQVRSRARRAISDIRWRTSRWRKNIWAISRRLTSRKA